MRQHPLSSSTPSVSRLISPMNMSAAWSAALLLGALSTACAADQSSSQARIGVSSKVDQSGQTEASADAEVEPAASDENSESAPANNSGAAGGETEEKPHDSAAQEKAPELWGTSPVLESPNEKAERLAHVALERVASSDNHLQLVAAVVERSSDLPWILAIENRSERDVSLAALPELLSFDIIAPSKADSDESATAQSSSAQSSAAQSSTAKQTSKAQEKTDAKPTHCGAKPPKKVTADSLVVLPAGATLTYPFDPRELCDSAEALQAGAEVRLSFGFPITKKKLWQKGKLVEVEETQKAPFVAEVTQQPEEEIVGLKLLNVSPFVLGSTYPLEALLAMAREQEQQTLQQQRAANGEDAEASDPLEVTLSPLGTSTDPSEGNIRTTVKNISDKSVTVYVRREHFAYQVVGPVGSTTCQMFPGNPTATELSFSTLRPGQSLSLTTRLAEACPKGTWGPPGDYQVAVLFTPNQDGAAFKKEAFVGLIRGKEARTLTIPGEKKPKMQVSAPAAQ